MVGWAEASPFRPFNRHEAVKDGWDTVMANRNWMNLRILHSHRMFGFARLREYSGTDQVLATYRYRVLFTWIIPNEFLNPLHKSVLSVNLHDWMGVFL